MSLVLGVVIRMVVDRRWSCNDIPKAIFVVVASGNLMTLVDVHWSSAKT